MALWIHNVSPDNHDSDAEMDYYEVKINNNPPLGEFRHWRHENSAACLRAAADAIDKKNGVETEWQKRHRERYQDDEAAKEIYDSWKDLPGWVPWTPFGNGLKQEDARSIARDQRLLRGTKDAD